jgi:hypothetical protein
MMNKLLSLLTLATLLVGPAYAEPLHYYSDFMKTGAPLRKTGNCSVQGKTVRLEEILESGGSRAIDTCVTPASITLTENGARGQIFSAWAAGSAKHNTSYTAWFLEVDCKRMESRSAEDWNLQQDEPDHAEKARRRYTYFKTNNAWASSSDTKRWTSWSPVTSLEKNTNGFALNGKRAHEVSNGHVDLDSSSSAMSSCCTLFDAFLY